MLRSFVPGQSPHELLRQDVDYAAAGHRSRRENVYRNGTLVRYLFCVRAVNDERLSMLIAEESVQERYSQLDFEFELHRQKDMIDKNRKQEF